MPHIIIIIDEKANCIKNKTQNLQNQCNALELVYEQFEKTQSDAAHAALHRAQELLTAICDGTATGSLSLDCCIDEISGFLN